MVKPVVVMYNESIDKKTTEEAGKL